MLANAVTKTIIQQTVQFVPSIPQFASGALSKCVAFGLPCIVSASRHPSAMANPGATQDALLALRGGNECKVDMERAGFRLSGIEQYCLISSILLGALTDMYSDVKIKDEYANKFEHFFRALYSVFIATSFSAALYATIVFSVLGLYGNTALGIGADSGYCEFVKATGFIRVSGFRSFLLCLITFKASFICNVILKFKGKTRWVVAAVCLSGSLLGMYHLSFMIGAASRLIYN